MKLIVAGSRTIDDVSFVKSILLSVGFDIKETVSEFVSGGANGIDSNIITIAEEWGIPCTVFKADWAMFHKHAGMHRNARMASYSDALLAIWDGSSPGTFNMINTMNEYAKPTSVHIYDKGQNGHSCFDCDNKKCFHYNHDVAPYPYCIKAPITDNFSAGKGAVFDIICLSCKYRYTAYGTPQSPCTRCKRSTDYGTAIDDLIKSTRGVGNVQKRK